MATVLPSWVTRATAFFVDPSIFALVKSVMARVMGTLMLTR